MGGSFSTGRGVKRPREQEQGEASSAQPSRLHTPKRKKFQSTSKYIVRTLFEEGTNSDVTIHTLGKEWHLHKLYLCQCKYFDSMFHGPWLESDQSTVSMEINDENINSNALKIAFKSLYTDHVFVKPVEAVEVLAAATFLHLDPLIEHCKRVMVGCVTFRTVVSFLAASERYGLEEVRVICGAWLRRCLMAPGHAPLLLQISEELLMTTLEDKDLWLLQVEVDVYTLIKKWLFLHLNQSWTGDDDQLYKDSKDFFKTKAEATDCCYLETDEGRCFISIFQRVRWLYVINDLSALKVIKEDTIVPLGWLDPFFVHSWYSHLRLEQGVDTGPNGVSEEVFYKHAMRCGRVMIREQEYHWRWLGYQYGLDLLFTVRNKTITMKRNMGGEGHHNFGGSLTQQKTRRVMLQLRVVQMDRTRDPVSQTSNVKCSDVINLLLIDDDFDFFLMALDQKTKFPLQVTMHMLYLSPPSPDQPVPSLAVPPPPVCVIPTPPPASNLSQEAEDEEGEEEVDFGLEGGSQDSLERHEEGTESSRASSLGTPSVNPVDSSRTSSLGTPSVNPVESSRTSSLGTPSVNPVDSSRTSSLGAPSVNPVESSRTSSLQSSGANPLNSSRTGTLVFSEAATTEASRATSTESSRTGSLVSSRATTLDSSRANTMESSRAGSSVSPIATAAQSSRTTSADSSGAGSLETPRANITESSRTDTMASSRATTLESSEANMSELSRPDTFVSPRATTSTESSRANSINSLRTQALELARQGTLDLAEEGSGEHAGACASALARAPRRRASRTINRRLSTRTLRSNSKQRPLPQSTSSTSQPSSEMGINAALQVEGEMRDSVVPSLRLAVSRSLLSSMPSATRGPEVWRADAEESLQ